VIILFRTSITIISLLIATNISAQKFTRANNIEVRYNDGSVKYAWAGGLNNPQFSNADLNNDDIDDLVIFDRKDDVFLTFISKGTPGEIDFEYAPEYTKHFPQVENWALLVDYDCDGVKDLFSSQKNFNHGSLYKGFYVDDELNFELEEDTLHYMTSEGVRKPIYIPLFDVPGIQDIDDDGDIDILTFNIAGGYLEYYKNLSNENDNNCEVSSFMLEDACYGKFYEPSLQQSLYLSENPDSCASRIGKRDERHPGSTILAIDTDEDADKELFLGDISWNNVNMLVNHGDLNQAYMAEQDTMFPSYDVPVFFNYFPGTYYVDVNNDNIRDFMVAPNGLNNAINYNCSWLYLNEGADNKLVVKFRQNNFLVGEMIDAGERSIPVLFDYNADGLLDLVVANAGYHTIVNLVDQLKSTLTLYENTGTIDEPAFELIDQNYLKLNDEFGFKDMRPAFADLDNDGDEDMLLGDSDGFVHYFKNEATSGQVANFSLYKPKLNGIDANQQAAPCLYDVTGDNLLDLIIGTRTGFLFFYKNVGTAEEPVFEEVSTNWGEVNVKEPGEVTAYSYPVLIELGEEKELTLLVGSESGKIHAFNQIVENIDSGAFNLITDNFLGETTGLFSTLAINNIDMDEELEIMVGNNRGGLSLYNDVIVPVNEVYIYETINVFPNPVSELLTIKGEQLGSFHLQLINVTGQLLFENTFTQQRTLSTKSYPNGIYFLKIKQKDVVKMAKFIIQK